MHFENHFHGVRSSRFILREGDSAREPHSHLQIRRPVIRSVSGGRDGAFQTSSDRSWRAVAATVSISVTKAAGVLSTCRESRLCRALDAAASWIFKQAFDGCAAYAAAMYGIPVGDLRDSYDPADDTQTVREHTDRSVNQTSGEFSTNANGNVLCLAESRIARLEAEFSVSPQPARAESAGRIASIGSIVAKIRSLIRQRRERRLAAELQCFDDRSLRDIGISRCDVEYLVRHEDRRE
jgi:uncharacterized protein YjiS (DUF1127 family)